jgi:hypothetical protein
VSESVGEHQAHKLQIAFAEGYSSILTRAEATLRRYAGAEVASSPRAYLLALQPSSLFTPPLSPPFLYLHPSSLSTLPLSSPLLSPPLLSLHPSSLFTLLSLHPSLSSPILSLHPSSLFTPPRSPPFLYLF